MTKHTPTPWTVDADEDKDDKTYLWRHITIPEINRSLHDSAWADPEQYEQDMANAEFIVRACNSHDALLAACKALMPYAVLAPDSHGWESVIESAEKAIAAAEPTKPQE